MNKATGERNCLVCGKRVGKNLVLCELCPRAYHTDCHNPVMPKVSNQLFTEHQVEVLLEHKIE